MLILLSQVLFWSALGFAEFKAHPEGQMLPASLPLFLTDNWQRLGEAERVDVTLIDEPAYFHLHAGAPMPLAIFAYDFDLSSETEDLALLLSWRRAIAEIRLNGMALKPQSPLDQWGSLGGFDQAVYILPGTALLDGENHLTFSVTGNRSKILPAFYVAEPQTILTAYSWGRLITVELAIAATAVMLFVALLWSVVYWPEESALRKRALVLLLLSWSLRNLTGFNIDGSLPPELAIWLHYLITFVFLMSLLLFAVLWTGASWQQAKRIALVGTALTFASYASYAVLTNLSPNQTAFAAETVLTIGVAVFFYYRFLFVRPPAVNSLQVLETLLFIICMTAVMVDAIDDRFAIHVPFYAELPLTFYVTPACGLLLALGSATLLATQSSRAQRTVQTANQTLQIQLAERTRELARHYEAHEKQEKERATLDERQRIMRDMHDGVGGQLSNLIAQVRQKDFTHDDIEKGLSETLHELRLIVDSLDTTGDTLPMALGAFRARVAPGLRGQGIELDWRIDADTRNVEIAPDAVLDVFRFLQEATSNVIQHSGASRVAISLSKTASIVSLVIEDNGTGFTDRPSRGRGVNNLNARAKNLGGKLEIESSISGVRVELKFPV